MGVVADIFSLIYKCPSSKTVVTATELQRFSGYSASAKTEF